MGPASPRASFWRDKRVLVTGHTGFKGSWLTLWLERLGARVTGLALAPETSPSLFELVDGTRRCAHRVTDVRDRDAVARAVQSARPEIVLHLAAQALVRRGYREPLDTLATNVMGTAHVLEALRGVDDVRVAVVITTDKVYAPLAQPWPCREDDPLGGRDPYSASKAACEHVVDCYRAAFLDERGVRVASARAGNVIGGGDWSADRLLPDAVRAWGAGLPLAVRRPAATRPWQHVLEPLADYLVLAERLWSDANVVGAWNFGPDTHEAATVRFVIELAQKAWGRSAVSWGDGGDGPHETAWLALETAKARTHLGVRSRWSLSDAVVRTMTWYRRQLDGADAVDLCHSDVDAWEAAA
jgi:CDP-glucose 4,6-dehydratase